MPESEFNLPILGIQINQSITTHKKIILRSSVRLDERPSCPHCGNPRVRIKAYRRRDLKHGFWADRLILLELRVPKFHCPKCKRYFMAHVPGVLPRKQSSEQFRKEVFNLHQGGLTLSRLSITHQISSSTVERWYQDYIAYRVKELNGRPCPMVLGIDEHFFTKKQGYATTLVDLRNHKVFDVVLGRAEADLGPYLAKLPGREKVLVVVMDLSDTYRRIVQKYFPNAMIVADRFHVIRWINHQFLKTWGEVDPEKRFNRSLSGVMRYHEWNLKDEKKERLQEYFKTNPAMKAIYDFKTGLNELLIQKGKNKWQAKALIPQLLWHMEECKNSPLPRFQELSRTLKRWLEPIARMWRFTKNNGITEGLHTKMEMISRRAFGFRNFQNYRMRVIALCGWDGVFKLRN